MARTIQQIQQEMFSAIAADANLVELTSTSKTAIYRLFVFIVSYCAWVLENLFDTHKSEVSEIITNDKAHRPNWYKTKALAFQYGFDLIPDSDTYDNTGYTNEEIEDSKIIKYCAVSKGGQKTLKIAKEVGGVLIPLSEDEKEAFAAYMDEIADWGVDYFIVNHLPDKLLLTIEIYRDPLVLNDQGMSIRTGKYPVEDAILEYMKELPFDGELVLAHLVDKLQLVPGVIIPNIVRAQSQSIDINTNTYQAAQPITVKTVPESGYFTIPNFDNVSYVV